MKIKKQFPVIITLCVAAAVVGGCKTGDSKEYDELNAKLQYNYSKIVLTVTDTFDEETVLTSEYTMQFVDGGVKVSYSVERFGQASLDAVAAEKTTLVGEAKITGGNVTYVSGDEVNLDALKGGTGLTFKKEYFDNIDLSGIYLKADVTNPSGFTGAPITCTGMKVNATFLDIFYDIKITYRAQNGNSVEYLYTFSM